MTNDLDALLTSCEGEQFERKSELDPAIPREMLGLIVDIVAMANTQGGRVLIGTKGNPIPESRVRLFYSARLDDKVNSLVEPRIGGITASPVESDFILVQVDKSRNSPHVFKKDGTYEAELRKQTVLFRSADIFVRHSSKTERANRSDLDRMFNERQRELLEKVRMVFEAPPGANIRIDDDSALAVRIDPASPDAKPVYDLLTPEPFRDFEQELMGALKAWKTSCQLLNETQVLKAYRARKDISDPAILELILRSCWDHRFPGYFWASQIAPTHMLEIIGDVIKTNTYPASLEALKATSLLPRLQARFLIQLGEQSDRRSINKSARKLEPVLRARTKKCATLTKLIHPGTKLRYQIGEGTKEVRIDALTEEVFDEILGTLLHGLRDNRWAFKISELIVYGPKLSSITLPEAGEIAEPDEANTSV
jgi:hypothetical protein